MCVRARIPRQSGLVFNSRFPYTHKLEDSKRLRFLMVSGSQAICLLLTVAWLYFSFSYNQLSAHMERLLSVFVNNVLLMYTMAQQTACLALRE
jgi:hypothetical protein